jgi:hypothetical protein
LVRILFISLILLSGTEVSSQYSLLKLNLASTAMGSPGVAFEKVKKKQFGWQLSASYHTPMFSGKGYYSAVLEEREFKSIDNRGFSVSGEYRFYTERARRDATKPYVAPFARYYQYSSEFAFTQDGYDFVNDGSMTTATAGLQFGVQWVVRNNWSIDLTMVGIGVSSSSLRSTLETNHPEPNIGLLEDDFSEVPLVGGRLQYSGSEGSYSFKDQYTTLGFRMALYVGLII